MITEGILDVASGRIISIKYVVTLDDGTVVESAEKPVSYFQGVGQLMPALEAKLEGTKEGTQKKFDLLPGEAYGERDESSIVTLPRTVFDHNHVELRVGMRLAAQTTSGDTYPITIKEIQGDRVVVDLNHPLAGKTLHFDVTIVGVREAATQEVFRGHPLSPELV